MVKAAGFLKKLKKLGQIAGKGFGWLNENVVKPLRPVIDTALDMTGFGTPLKKVVDFGSNLIDEYSGYKPTIKDGRVKKIVERTSDFALDTQRAPQDKKYTNPFLNRLN